MSGCHASRESGKWISPGCAPDRRGRRDTAHHLGEVESADRKDILEGYGLSETSPILTLNPMTKDEFSATVGLPFPSTDIKLLDGDGKEVALGETGEVCAKGPQVMKGYWQKPEANAAAFTVDGYFRTGDIGVFDERGSSGSSTARRT